MSAPLTPEERREAVERATELKEDALRELGLSRWTAADGTEVEAADRYVYEQQHDLARDVLSLAAALAAVEQERDGQHMVAKMALDDLDAQRERAEAAEREVVRLKAQLADVEDVARSAISWAPGNAKITLAQRLEDALASVSEAEPPVGPVPNEWVKDADLSVPASAAEPSVAGEPGTEQT